MRVAISQEERVASAERVTSRLFDVPALQTARTVLSFSSFGSEVPTEGIVRRLRDEGRRVLLPFVEGQDMEAAEVPAGDPLVATDYGPMEPTERLAVHPSEVDVVLVPALAFDRLGYRVGYGGGLYDRYLVRLGPRAVRVGIAFHAQLLPAVPHGVEDEPVDVVVTEAETVDCRTERRASKPSGR
jgi:5-formyltetrahydrofolate cyclo-ligase